MDAWTAPLGLPRISHLFDERNIAKHLSHEKFSCSGSELLTLVPIGGRFFGFVFKNVDVLKDEVHRHNEVGSKSVGKSDSDDMCSRRSSKQCR